MSLTGHGTKLEFSVEMTCEKCVKKIFSALQVEGIKDFEIDFENQRVLVETILPSQYVQNLIEKTQRHAVLKGAGSATGRHLGAAVAMLDAPGISGVVRFLQLDTEMCLVDGTVDGLSPGKHGLHVHEFGDLSDNCNRLGQHFNPRSARHGNPENDSDNRHMGDLGNISSDSSGRAEFRFTDRVLKVGDVIGRSLAISENRDDLGLGSNTTSAVDGNSGNSLVCGIIARSAGLFENPKRICACDGLTLWEEREKMRGSTT